VVDAYYGDNVAKAISSFESVHSLPADGKLDAGMWLALSGDGADPVLIEHEITAEDLGYDFAESIPEDHAEMAKMERLAYTSPEEMLAERFHMDIDLLKALNADMDFSQVGTKILVADVES
jgi:peptidoglycan hydrolase-like protein with peptidoglycan-binding domain